jgi:hypothetical protein
MSRETQCLFTLARQRAHENARDEGVSRRDGAARLSSMLDDQRPALPVVVYEHQCEDGERRR